MAYDEQLAERVRRHLAKRNGLTERKMFGRLAFMISGNMCCGVVGEDLMVRVGPDAYDDALAQPGAKPMDFTGRPMRGMVYVSSKATSDDAVLAAWVERGAAFASSLPAK